MVSSEALMMAPSTIVMISMRLIAKESKQPMMFLLNGSMKHAVIVSMVLIKLVSPVVNTSHANLVITSINLMIMFLPGTSMLLLVFSWWWAIVLQ